MRKIAMALAMIGVHTHAGAVLVADGKLGPAGVDKTGTTLADFSKAAVAEGYSIGWNVEFTDKGKAIGTGQLWFGTDGGGNQYIYYLLPITYVDNTYGKNSSAGWGGTGGHTFSNLLGSDSMGEGPNFTWVDSKTGTTNAARIDYIANCSTDPSPATNCDTNAANNGSIGGATNFRSAGVGTGSGVGTGALTGTNGGGAKWTQMDVSLTGSASSILEIATSLEWDLQNVCANCTVDSSLSASWLKEVGYELKFAPGTFDPGTFGNNVVLNAGGTSFSSPGVLNYGDPHVSPPMATVSSFGPPCLVNPTTGTCGPGTAPEPGTTWLLGLALGGLGFYARRRNKKSRPDTAELPCPDKPDVPVPS